MEKIIYIVPWAGGYRAIVKRPRISAFDFTGDEAVGKLVREHPEVFHIKLSDKLPKRRRK